MQKTVSGMVLAFFLIGTFTLTFNVGLVHAQAETIYINSDGSVSPSSAPISTVDNVTYVFTGNMSYPTYDGVVVERNNIVIDGNGYTVQGNNSGNVYDQSVGLNLTDTSNVTIENANIQGFYYGIYLNDSNDSVINSNKASANLGFGIYLHSSSNNIVYGNNATANSYGVSLYSSSNNNTVSGNTATASVDYGIWLDSSSNNTVIGNKATANDVTGIEIDFSSNNNTVSGNNATANSDYGIYLSGSNNNIVSGNNATANNYAGIGLYSSSNNAVIGNNATTNNYGIYLFSSRTSGSSINTIYRNNFIGNIVQASVDPTSVGNVWDNGYPSGGNFWSDYNGTDLYNGKYQNVTGSDGIGDTSYVIDANDADTYPLMAPFRGFDIGAWNGVAYSVDTVSNSMISDFGFNPTDKTLSFNVTGASGTVGFCRVAIPKAVMWCDNETQWAVVIEENVGELFLNVHPHLSIMTDASYTYIYFAYAYSTDLVTITSTSAIPEFQPSMLLALLMILTLLGAIVFKKRAPFMSLGHLFRFSNSALYSVFLSSQTVQSPFEQIASALPLQRNNQLLQVCMNLFLHAR